MRKLLKTTKYHNRFPFTSKGSGNQLLLVCINPKHSDTSGTKKSFGLWIWQPQNHPYWLLKVLFGLRTVTAASHKPQSLTGQAVSSGVKLQNPQQCGQCPPASHGAFQCLEQLHLTHLTQSWSGCNSHLWKTLWCWIPDMAKEHSYFKPESSSLWCKNAPSLFQTLCSSWVACMHGWSSVSHTQCCSLSRNYSFFAKHPELSFRSQHGEHGHTELYGYTYLFFGSLIFAM